MAVPEKYKEMGDFRDYYLGKKRAPLLTIIIGGNHEASYYMRELYYGGWVAENIYYLGASSVIDVRVQQRGREEEYELITIAGVSGIEKSWDYLRGLHEAAPYDQSAMRSIYHYR